MLQLQSAMMEPQRKLFTPDVINADVPMQSMNQLNVLPAKHDMSEHCSPETIVAGQTINYNEHCTHKFGKCTQAHHEAKKKNSVKEQTIDTIHSQPTNNEQGRHKVMNSSAG